MEKIVALVFGLFILLNEIVLHLSVDVGTFMYVALMSVALIILSGREVLSDFDRMVVVFLAIPLVRIAGLFVDLSYIWKVFLGHGVLLFLGIYYLYKFDIDIGKVGKHLWLMPVVIFFGAVIGALANVLFASGGNLVFIMLLPLVVFSEEIFFRGLMQNLIERSCGVCYSVIIPAVIYGALSLHLGIWLAVLFFLVGIFSALVYLSTRNIFVSIAFNLTVSIFVFIIPNLN
ncbi:CPBP family intramembrane metalloprotease [Candidatus Pacearchaeota archaeon]|nr:CPBP family intramembrane metalloprotease [Candidatus Pacearchaeota archaeon]